MELARFLIGAERLPSVWAAFGRSAQRALDRGAGKHELGIGAGSRRASPFGKEHSLSTSTGATFTAPQGWKLTVRGPLQLLEAPEADSTFGVIDVEGDDAEACVANAWAAFEPEMKRALKLVTERPGRNGWKEAKHFAYEVGPTERLVTYAFARRHGKIWTIFLANASEATFDRRSAQVALITDSLRPNGFVMESFAGRAPHPLDATRIATLGEFVKTAQRELGIPGVALGLIDQRKVVFDGGFGVRELGKHDPVTAETLFMIGSNTKGLSTLLLAKLVDEG